MHPTLVRKPSSNRQVIGDRLSLDKYAAALITAGFSVPTHPEHPWVRTLSFSATFTDTEGNTFTSSQNFETKAGLAMLGERAGKRTHARGRGVLTRTA
jgi:hypothetical protein